jgi:hypothetical protein
LPATYNYYQVKDLLHTNFVIKALENGSVRSRARKDLTPSTRRDTSGVRVASAGENWADLPGL